MSLRKILVPFDFSEISLNAIKYAIDYSDENDELYILHCYSGLLNVDNTNMLAAGKTHANNIQKEMNDIIIKHLQLETLPKNISLQVLTGDPVHTIVKFAKSNFIDKAFVGTRDKYDLFDKWVGTISLGLVKQLFIPVYLIPKNSSFSGFDKVVVATDYHLAKKQIINEIKRWNENHNAYLKFIHVKDFLSSTHSTENKTIVSELFENENVDFAFDISTVNSKNIGDSLLKHAYDNNAELLIVIAENHSLMHSLLFKSLSKELILKSSIPVLFLHD